MKKDQTAVKRLLPEVPIKELPPPPSYEESEEATKPKHKQTAENVNKVNNPMPAPRPSLLEEAKVDKEPNKKKTSAKKHKNTSKDIVTQVPLYIETDQIKSERIEADRNASENRPLSPDSALASSESSGGKQGKTNYLNLVKIAPYEQFKPVIRKSAKIQEKIAIFSPTEALPKSPNYLNATASKVLNFCDLTKKLVLVLQKFRENACSFVDYRSLMLDHSIRQVPILDQDLCCQLQFIKHPLIEMPIYSCKRLS